MRKLSLILIVFILSSTYINSKSRTSEEAYQIAKSHLNKKSNSSRKIISSTELQPVFLAKNINSSEIDAPYYIYNIGVNGGFVIVSGDDRAKTILGYANTGSFNSKFIPDGVKYWLDGYANEIKSLKTKPDNDISINTTPVKMAQNISNSRFAASIAPLLENIKWNQDSPYNNLCPVINTSTNTRAVTGCVATGMAQVMKYHQWPVQGTGSNSYTTKTNKISLSEDFSQTTYDWANMTYTYTTESTDVQQNAVAALMYHCGVAVNMDYGKTSSAYFTDMAKALKNNFGYDANLNLILRDYYTRTEWIDWLKTELNATRPVLYGGQSAEGGHLFVCDGYDSNGFFHFNWGWGGSSDGYYELTALHPSSQGVADQSAGYNSGHTIVVGIQKPSPTSVPVYIINMNQLPESSAASMARTGTTTITLQQIYNQGINTFTGNIGLAIYNDNGFVQVIKDVPINELKSNYGWNSWTMKQVSLSTLAQGHYKLYAVYKATGETNWTVVRGKTGTPNYLNVSVSPNEINFNTPNVAPVLTLNELNVTGNLYQDKTGRFSVRVTNSGDEYNSILAIHLVSTADQTVSQLLTEDANIITGETKTYYFNETLTLAPGEYSLTAMYDPTNSLTSDFTFSQLGNGQTVTITTAPVGEPDLQLQSIISFPNNTAVNKNNAALTARIKNLNGFFENDIIAFIFPETGGNSLTYLGYQTAVFDTNEEKTVTFGGPVNLDPNQYMAAVYYWSSAEKWERILPLANSSIQFTLVNTPTGFLLPENIDSFDIYPNPAAKTIYFKSDEVVNSVNLYHFSGQLMRSSKPLTTGVISLDVSTLETGNYLLEIKTTKGIKVSKFIKK